MPYAVYALCSVIIFASIHLWADKLRVLNNVNHARLLSFCGGVSIAYVFVDILPKLCINDEVVHNSGFFPYIERHVFVMALIGFLVFFCVDRSHQALGRKSYFWLSISSVTLFNFLIGYAVAEKNDPEVQPLELFTFALALHYFVIDYSLNEAYGRAYSAFGKWILIAALFLGLSIGLLTKLSETAVALIAAFIGGGVIMNVIRHELPADKPHSLPAFLISVCLYTAVLLSLSH